MTDFARFSLPSAGVWVCHSSLSAEPLFLTKGSPAVLLGCMVIFVSRIYLHVCWSRNICTKCSSETLYPKPTVNIIFLLCFFLIFSETHLIFAWHISVSKSFFKPFLYSSLFYFFSSISPAFHCLLEFCCMFSLRYWAWKVDLKRNHMMDCYLKRNSKPS